MKEHIDVITKLSEELYNSSNGLHTVDLCKCDTWQMIIDDMLLQIEAIRFEIYESQHESCLEHVVDLANVPDFEPEDVPF